MGEKFKDCLVLQDCSSYIYNQLFLMLYGVLVNMFLFFTPETTEEFHLMQSPAGMKSEDFGTYISCIDASLILRQCYKSCILRD